MKSLRWLVLGMVLSCATIGALWAADPAPPLVAELKTAIGGSAKLSDPMKKFVGDVLIELVTDKAFADAVTAQNTKAMPKEEIEKIDKEWQAAEDELPIQKEKTSNDCAKRVKEFVAAHPMIVEMFVMDNQGGNVGQNQLTSDYWQGDEPKWQNSFNSGKGGLDVGDLKLDKSSNAEVQQISLPVIDASGKVIGAFTAGVVPSKL